MDNKTSRPLTNQGLAMKIIATQKIVTRVDDEGDVYITSNIKKVTVIDDDDVLSTEVLNAAIVNAIKNRLNKTM